MSLWLAHEVTVHPNGSARCAHEVVKWAKINSLAPGGCDCIYKCENLETNFTNRYFNHSSGIAFRWMPQELIGHRSTLVHAMTRCSQAPSHYLNQCPQSSMAPYGVNRPWWFTHRRLNKTTHFVDDARKCIFMNEKYCNAIEIPLILNRQWKGTELIFTKPPQICGIVGQTIHQSEACIMVEIFAGIFKCIFVKEYFVFKFKIQWNEFISIQIGIR